MPSFNPDKPFITLNHSIKERERKKLKFAKCPNCGLVTPYRLMLRVAENSARDKN